ncbi:MAG: DUF4115 domain-containing protein [Candidatus Omnitrophica bacterium]|nr:DUF4115 domain-containing protein [Candidatus Omnitrophota bacterium]
MIEEICVQLREKRKKMGYSLEEVVEKTKLHPTAIRDIEDGKLNKISPAYLKGFIRIYADFLGVDASEALRELSPGHVSPRKQQKREDQAGTGGPRQPRRRKVQIDWKKLFPPAARKLLARAVLALIALFLVIQAGRFIGRSVMGFFQRRSAEAPSVPAPRPQPVPAPRPEETPAAAAPRAEPVTASVTAKRNVFLRVKVDGKLLFEGVLRKGAVETWKGTSEIEFKISDGSAVYIEANGEPLPSLTSLRKPIKSLKIDASGISVTK